MKEDTTHIRAYESDKERIKATLRKGNVADQLSHIIKEHWTSGPHYPVLQERENKPLGPYVRCRDCGRSENTLDELNNRPCEDGIPVDKREE
jgi:hypothetical protein